MKRMSTLTSKLKRYSSLTLAVLCTATMLLSSCNDEPIYSQSGGEDGVSVKIHLTAPVPAIAQTRSVAETDDSYFNPNGVYLMVFANSNDEENKDKNQLIQIAKATGSDNLYNAQLKSTNACYVYVIANAEAIISENLAKWEKESPTLASIKSAFKYTLPTKQKGENGTVITQMIAPQPMMVEVPLDKIGVGTQIGSKSDPVQMKRSTVKITISNETKENRTTGLYRESLKGANLINTPAEGYLFPMDNSTLTPISRYNTAGETDLNGLIAEATEAGTENETCTLYSFESADGSGKPTALVIQATFQGTPYYYCITLNREEKDYALLRNLHYTVRISEVKREGCATMEEAIAKGNADNIDYVVNVTDDTSQDILTDGEYYLGMSNSEFFALTNAQVDNTKVTTISYNYPKAGTVTVVSGNVKIYQSDLPACTNTNSPQSIELTANIGANSGTSVVRIHFSDKLEKEITIYQGGQPDKFGTVLKDYAFSASKYISARVEEGDQEWLKLTTKESAEEIIEDQDLFERFESEEGKINIRVKANLGDNSSDPYRIGYVNYFRNDNVGNARVLVRQEMHNVYEDVQEKAQEKPYTYVGTFHRYNQVAERIIRVDPQIAGGGTFKWRAFVIYGDFIRLSLTESKDQINENDFYGNGDASTTFGEALESGDTYKVLNGKTEVSDFSATRIFFRVGLTSKIAPTATRYGLIGLQVNKDIDDGKITRYIFVRQGEEADYLMRPQDLIEQNPNFKPDYNGDTQYYGTKRPLAAKFSPFNLTDPAGNFTSDLRGKKGIFTTYPSQGGYLYQAVSRIGWVQDPANPVSGKPQDWDMKSDKPLWNEDSHETCPEGYEHPSGGKEELVGTEYKTDPSVQFASVRQSLWLYPGNLGVSETQNFIIGYMADGYYDRQPMRHEVNIMEKSKQPVAVNNGAGIAFIGVLAFNPHTVASIFLPLAGEYNPATYKYVNAGQTGSFQTKTRTNNYRAGVSGAYQTVDWGYMVSGNSSFLDLKPNDTSEKFRVDNYSNHSQASPASVRCVKKR